MTSEPTIRTKERDAILQSLAAGVVPRLGLQHIQVGRAREVHAILQDLERVSDGGPSIRLIIGEYGSGKTFFLQLMRLMAMRKGLATAHADLGPDGRLHATGGQARSSYAELMHNLSTRSRPDGAALPAVVERFIASARELSRKTERSVTEVIYDRLANLSEMVGGYDFATVVDCCWRGHENGNEALQADAIRWLRAEYATKTLPEGRRRHPSGGADFRSPCNLSRGNPRGLSIRLRESVW